MKAHQPTSHKAFLIFLVISGWFALIFQFYMIINSGKASTSELIIRYFSYFTILSNLLVTVSASLLLFKPKISLTGFLSQSKTLTATTVYIVIVSLIYNTILRFVWHPEGLQKVVDELLHLIIPITFFIYWLLFVNKKQLQWRDFQPWLIFPLVYMAYTLLRGVMSGFYPYPFMNVNHFGYVKVLTNAFFIGIVFTVVSLSFIGLAKLMTKREKYK